MLSPSEQVDSEFLMRVLNLIVGCSSQLLGITKEILAISGNHLLH